MRPPLPGLPHKALYVASRIYVLAGPENTEICLTDLLMTTPPLLRCRRLTRPARYLSQTGLTRRRSVLVGVLVRIVVAPHYPFSVPMALWTSHTSPSLPTCSVSRCHSCLLLHSVCVLYSRTRHLANTCRTSPCLWPHPVDINFLAVVAL
jgi:hypothetical protein